MNIQEIKNGLPELDLTSPHSPSPQEQEYLRYYDIDFSKQLDGVSHYFGTVPCEQSKGADVPLMTHYFKREDAVATCLVVHGFTDHVGIFGQLIDYLLHRGCSVIAFDLPGHGLSGGEQVHINDFSDYQRALEKVLSSFKGAITSPLHLCGQSMGGAIVMDFLLSGQFVEREEKIEKVVLLAPLVRPAGWRSIRLANALLSPFLSSVKRTFTESSNDKEFLAFQRHRDPLQTRRLKTTWVKAMIRWVKYFGDLSWCDHPILVIQGLQDETVDFRYGLEVIRDKFPKSQVLRIKDARHHLACEDQVQFGRVMDAADLYFDRRKQPR